MLSGTSVIGGAMWGWHSEVGLHVLRLHAAGVFDKFPRLKIILGHFGEVMPFMLQRIQDQEIIMGKQERPFIQVWDENICITTCVAWSLDPMRCILSNTKIEHIMYSIDYPFTPTEHGLRWIDARKEWPGNKGPAGLNCIQECGETSLNQGTARALASRVHMSSQLDENTKNRTGSQ